MGHILIIEDDITFCLILEGFLKRNGYTVSTANTVKDGIDKLRSSPNLLLLDYRLPDGTGMDILDEMHKQGFSIPAIIMTSFHDVRTAVQAIKKGAFDFITKPVNHEELLMLIKQALETPQQERETKSIDEVSFVEGKSETSRQLHSYISLVAPTDMSVLIQGESGTGKEQVARTLHNFSKRHDAPFIAIDCGALSADLSGSELFGHTKGAFTGAMQDKTGQFEAANGGTLFLDEVGNLSYDIQVKLLRALQERIIQPLGSNKSVKVDVRIITATNDDLIKSVKNGSFREDLYHRINEFKIQIPSLQERKEDLDEFVAHFIQQGNAELGKKISGISKEVKDLFHSYDWPGNLRELKNIIKRAVLLTTQSYIQQDALPAEMVLSVGKETTGPAVSNLKTIQAQTERDLIIKTLQEVRYNKSKAAKILNIDRTTLYYKMSKYNIEG